MEISLQWPRSATEKEKLRVREVRREAEDIGNGHKDSLSIPMNSHFPNERIPNNALLVCRRSLLEPKAHDHINRR